MDTKGFISSKDYRVCLKNLPIVTVDLLIFNPNKDQILLFKRKNKPLKGEFYTLGGRVFKNETIDKAILRKAREECGIDVLFSDLVFGGIIDEIFRESIYSGIETHCVNIFFGYIAVDVFDVRIDNQHDDFKWFSVGNKRLNPCLKKKIKLTLSKL